MLVEGERQELSRYSKVMTFSLDDARRNVKAQDRELYDNLTKSFYESLYHTRTWAESEMARLIRDSKRVLSIEGIEGCGKSTITRKVLNALSEDYPSLLLDFNLLSNDPAFKQSRDYQAFNAALADVLRRELLAKYYASQADRVEALYDLALFSEEPVTVREFIDERMRLSFLASRNIPGTAKKEQRDWYDSHKTADSVRSLREDIYHKLTYSHLIVVLRDALPYKDRFIVVLDNVDRLQRQVQPYCYDFALSFNNEMYEFAKIVLNIRPESAHLPIEITGQKSEHVDTVRLVDLGDKDYLKSYLDSQGFHLILASRQKLYSTLTKGSALPGKLMFLTDALKDEYAELILIDLANQSIRTALEYHCKFLEYLLTVCPYASLEQFVRARRHKSLLVSCLLAWIAECGEVLSDQSLNLAKLVRDAENSGYRTRGCDLSYLILVCLRKQTINPQGEEIYRMSLRALTRRLAVLGFSEEEVRQEVYHLYYNKNKEFGHIITISQDEIVHDQDSIDSKTRISLNFRGKRLVETVGIMFFFVNRLLNKTAGRDVGKDPGVFGYFDYSNYMRHATENLRLFARVARLHSIELVRIAENIGAEDWLRRYLNDFAIDGTLQLDRTLKSNIRFLQGHEQDPSEAGEHSVARAIWTMNVLLELYNNLVETITPSTNETYDFDRIVKECLETSTPLAPSKFKCKEYMIDVRHLIDAGRGRN